MSIDAAKQRTIGIVGLGLMGTALTERFLEAGWLPHIWNRSPEKAKALTDKGAVWSDNPLAECSQVVISLYSGDVVDEVLLRFQNSLRPGQMLIDTTTGDPTQAVMRAARVRLRAEPCGRSAGVHRREAGEQRWTLGRATCAAIRVAIRNGHRSAQRRGAVERIEQ